MWSLLCSLAWAAKAACSWSSGCLPATSYSPWKGSTYSSGLGSGN